MSNHTAAAPDNPGIPARWTSSAKSGIGKALNPLSEVSFTISHGIINEIYYPREDQACTRDMELLVTDGKDFFSEEKRDTAHTTKMIAEGVPAYKIMNECLQHRYRTEKEIIADPLRNTVLQKIKFVPLTGTKGDYHLYVLLAPHIGNHGGGNTAWTGDYKGIPMLFARRNNQVLALACSHKWVKRSVGFVGASDGWTDIKQHKLMTLEYQSAENGNVALVAEIDLNEKQNTFLLAVGFGQSEIEAGHYAQGSIMDGFYFSNKRFVHEWQDWQKSLKHPKSVKVNIGRLSRISAAVLRMHEAKCFVGGTIASMSIPWGFSRGDNDIGGYHLVWPRDLVEIAGGFLAMHSNLDAYRVINYLMVTQEADGHWPQNMWLEGQPFLKGVQMDQTALPVLLVDLYKQHRALAPDLSLRYWSVVKKAVSYLIQHGPFTQLDRWEEEPGITLFTLASSISALLAAADFAEEQNEPELAKYCRQTADSWNDNIENWTYVTDTPLAKELGVDGYYIRINPSGISTKNLKGHSIRLKNHTDGKGIVPVNELISVDALALVRFGLRAANDPRILNTIKAIDAKLKVDTPCGPCWHRYNDDGYGEHENGGAFDGTGIGRAWPLLTGERAHYEIAAGHFDKAKALLKTMESFANHGLFSEQIWDTNDIPELDLFIGKHSGSAMPLVWAHAEYIKLCYSLIHKKVFDMPHLTQERYIRHKVKVDWKVWRFNYPCNSIPKGENLHIETMAPALIHWSADGWKTVHDISTHATGLNIQLAVIPKEEIKNKDILFTFYWKDSKRWENKNYKVDISETGQEDLIS